MKLTIIFFTVLFVVPGLIFGQTKISPKDSVEIKNQIEGFYSWYVTSIENHKLNEEFNPKFVRSDDGMTALDFNNYKAGLRKYKFYEDFIQRKIKGYSECVDNLSKIPFDKFSQFKDLDDFEDIKCDFSNRYEWTGGMEPISKAELSSLRFVDARTVLGQVDFFFGSYRDSKAMVTLSRTGKEWRIDNLVLGR